MAEGVRCACAVAGGGVDESLGAEGAATVARALESGRCSLTSLNLGGEWGALVLWRTTALRCIAMPCWAAVSRVL